MTDHKCPRDVATEVDRTAQQIAARYNDNPHTRLGATQAAYAYHYQMLYSSYLSATDQLDRLKARLAEAEMRLQEMEIEAGTL